MDRAVYAASRPGGRIDPGPAPAVSSPPGWLERVGREIAGVAPSYWSRFLPPDEGGRESAVLMLFGPAPADATESGTHVLLIERAHHSRSHAAQIAFPGGSRDPEDESLVATALREAQEETGLDPGGVDVVTNLPSLFLPPSRFVVAPVLGWWDEPSPVGVVDPGEVADVMLVPVQELVDPAHRRTVTHPSGFVGPAFEVGDHLVWGFTGGLLAKLLDLAGVAEPWDVEHRVPLPERYLGSRGRS